jgi:hypothetical protein
LEVRRLERRGALHRFAHGYYIVVPQQHVGTGCMPALGAVVGVGVGLALEQGGWGGRMRGWPVGAGSGRRRGSSS